jgi:hypothetical protein
LATGAQRCWTTSGAPTSPRQRPPLKRSTYAPCWPLHPGGQLERVCRRAVCQRGCGRARGGQLQGQGHQRSSPGDRPFTPGVCAAAVARPPPLRALCPLFRCARCCTSATPSLARSCLPACCTCSRRLPRALTVRPPRAAHAKNRHRFVESCHSPDNHSPDNSQAAESGRARTAFSLPFCWIHHAWLQPVTLQDKYEDVQARA